MNLTAAQFIKDLESIATDSQKKNYERILRVDKKDQFLGVRMGSIFKLAKEYMQMDLKEVEKLLDSKFHDARVGAVSIMDFKARDKKIDEKVKKEVFDLYLRKHDRINSWDLVDRSAIYVVGSFLADKDRKILYKLAKSKFMPERRTAILATAFFMMKLKETNDTFKIAEILLKDKEDLIHKAVGWMLRVAGDVDKKALLKFLDQQAKTMPRVMLRYSIEKLDKKQKDYYMKSKNKGRSEDVSKTKNIKPKAKL